MVAIRHGAASTGYAGGEVEVLHPAAERHAVTVKPDVGELPVVQISHHVAVYAPFSLRQELIVRMRQRLAWTRITLPRDRQAARLDEGTAPRDSANVRPCQRTLMAAGSTHTLASCSTGRRMR